MKLNIAVGGFLHETNTFVEKPTRWADFATDGPWPGAKSGAELLEVFPSLNLGLGGFMRAAGAGGHRFHPLAWAMAMPGGLVTRNAFEHMAAMITGPLAKKTPDLVFLELHGAMVAEGYDDAEAELLRRVRAVVGEDVPIIATLDLHANVSAAMAKVANLLHSFRTYPHVDWANTGVRLANWIDRVMQWGPNNGRVVLPGPFLVPVTSGCTMVEPARSLYRKLDALEKETGINLSLNMGFCAADIADTGPSVLAYGADQAKAEAAAERLFATLVSAESDFATHRPVSAKVAVGKAKAIAKTAQRPVILADTQDNPGAGTPSNTTGLVAELLDQDAQNALMGIFHDPEVAAKAHRRGIGRHIKTLGGGGEGPGQHPLPGPWEIVALSDGQYIGSGPMLRNTVATMGPSCILQMDGVKVLVASIRQQPLHREVFSHIGQDPRSFSILALKSSAHFRSGFQDIAERVIVCLSPGMNLEDPSNYQYVKLRPDIRRAPRTT